MLLEAFWVIRLKIGAENVDGLMELLEKLFNELSSELFKFLELSEENLILRKTQMSSSVISKLIREEL